MQRAHALRCTSKFDACKVWAQHKAAPRLIPGLDQRMWLAVPVQQFFLFPFRAAQAVAAGSAGHTSLLLKSPLQPATVEPLGAQASLLPADAESRCAHS